MANSAMTSRSMPSQASLQQTLSLLSIYSRLPGLVIVPPLTSLLIPVVYLVLNYATSGHAHIALISSIAFYTLGIFMIHRLASSPEKVAKALERSEVSLPGISVALSVLLRYFLTYFAGNSFSSYPALKDLFGIFGRIAAALFLLEVAVVLRYVGPFSIMRCSSVPLIGNPFASSIRYFIAYPGAIFEPNDIRPAIRAGSILQEESPTGRRYQHPSASSIFHQVIFLIFMGVVCCVICWPSENTKSAGMTACLSLFLSPLMDYVCQHNHELDPRPYTNWSNGGVAFLAATTSLAIYRAAVGSVFITMAAVLLDRLCAPEETISLVIVGLQVLTFSFLCLVVQRVWEEMLRYALLYPKNDVTQEILAKTDSSYSGCVRVMLDSLLQGSALVNDICAMTTPESLVQLHEAETNRVRVYMRKWSRELVERLSLYVEAPLEEDIFRLGILEALGGPEKPSCVRHSSIVADWRSHCSPLVHGGTFLEPPIATLLRGLCVSVGGSGKALTDIAVRARGPPSMRKVETWVLSVGFLTTLEYTLTALGRILELDSHTRELQSGSRNAKCLDGLTPIALECIYELFTGLENYRATQYVLNPDRLQTVTRACERAAAQISPRFNKSGYRSARSEVNVWIKSTNDLQQSGASARYID